MEVPSDGVKSKMVSEDELNANLDVYEGKENPRIPLPDIEDYKKLAPAKWVTGAEHAAAIEARRERRKKERLKRMKAKQK